MNKSSIVVSLIAALFLIAIVSFYQKSSDMGIRAIGTSDNLYGYHNSTYIIGDQIKESNIFDSSGLHIETSCDILTSITITDISKYELSNGVRIGTSKAEIISIMGDPLRSEIAIDKGSIQIASIDALVYSKVIILIDQNELASSITLGSG